jgi:hypothetical protein
MQNPLGFCISLLDQENRSMLDRKNGSACHGK